MFADESRRFNFGLDAKTAREPAQKSRLAETEIAEEKNFLPAKPRGERLTECLRRLRIAGLVD